VKMFTVCPKCALTLVVTAQDLRVAQGYVRCGRCSNVFNALARLSEDRNAAATASSQPPAALASTGINPKPAPPDTSAPSPAQAASPQQPSASSSQRQSPSQPTASYTYTRPPAPTSRQAPAASAPPPAPPPPPNSVLTGGDLDDDEAIPEDALEFNPAAADVNQVFIEPPPNPEWTAATGTFKALVFKNEEPDEESEIELDADFLSSTAEMRRLKMGLSEDDSGVHPALDENNISAAPASKAVPEPTRQRPGPQPQSPPSRTPAAATHPAATPPAAPPPHASAHSQFAPSSRPASQAPRSSTAETLAHGSSGLPHGSSGQSQPQLHAFLSETQSQPKLRSSTSDTQSQPQLRTPHVESQSHTRTTHPEPDTVTDVHTVSRPQGRKTIRAFGLDSGEQAPVPSELRLAALARSRIAPSSLELEPPSRISRLAKMVTDSPTLWTGGVCAMGILLAAQIINHYRNDLAATPQFNKPITALYAAFGVTLTPHWDLRVYDVRQLGASVDAESAGQIMVRASVKNGGHQAQPMPLLRVTLQDRFGNRIAARDVAPGNYLPRAIPATSFLSAGQRIDAEMAFVDPGANAVGFEIDACLPAPGGGIACANDPVTGR
jgi:predicted Zn finger-like uncharacterized protein